MEDINGAFIYKQGWKVLNQPDNIWVRIIKVKYLENDKDNFLVSRRLILPCQHGKHPGSKNPIKRALKWILGNRQSTNFWQLIILS